MIASKPFFETFEVEVGVGARAGERIPRADIVIISSTAELLSASGASAVNSTAEVVGDGLVSLFGVVPDDAPTGAHMRTSVRLSVGGVERVEHRDSGTVVADIEPRIAAIEKALVELAAAVGLIPKADGGTWGWIHPDGTCETSMKHVKPPEST